MLEDSVVFKYDCKKIIQQLSLSERRLLTMMLFGYKYKEIAEHMHTNVNVIKKRMQRLKKKIRKAQL